MATKPRSTPRKRGRKPVHDRRALVVAACERIAKGELVRNVCQSLGFSRTMLFEWTNEQTPVGRQLANLYARAREEQAHAIAEGAVLIADGEDEDAQERLDAMVESIEDADDDDKDRMLAALAASAIQRDKLRVDARKWLASKIAPRHYGEKLELAGHDGGPMTVSVVYSRE